MEEGNYLKMAIYTIHVHHTFDDICQIHDRAVKNTKTRRYDVLHTTIVDFLSMTNIDYIFNSWRCLSSIEKYNGAFLSHVNSFKLKEEEINDLYINDNNLCTLILLEYHYKMYLISSIISSDLSLRHIKNVFKRLDHNEEPNNDLLDF